MKITNSNILEFEPLDKGNKFFLNMIMKGDKNHYIEMNSRKHLFNTYNKLKELSENTEDSNIDKVDKYYQQHLKNLPYFTYAQYINFLLERRGVA